MKPDAKLQHPPGSLQYFVEVFVLVLVAAASGRVLVLCLQVPKHPLAQTLALPQVSTCSRDGNQIPWTEAERADTPPPGDHKLPPR